MANKSRRSHNNNPEGRNQYSSDWKGTVRDNPMTSAAAAAAAVGAGVFLWSKRGRISDQISRLSEQVSNWADEWRSGSTDRALVNTPGVNESNSIKSSRSTSTGKTNRTGAGDSLSEIAAH